MGRSIAPVYVDSKTVVTLAPHKQLYGFRLNGQRYAKRIYLSLPDHPCLVKQTGKLSGERTIKAIFGTGRVRKGPKP